MKTVTKNVTSARDPETGKKLPKAIIVGIAKWDEPETLKEAVEKFGEVKVLDRFNAQLGTDVTNEMRAKAVQPVSRDKIRDMLIDEGVPFNDDAMIAARGDGARQKARMDELINERIAKIATDRKAQLAEVQAAAEATGGDTADETVEA